jgi:purine nucleoside permease
MAKSTSLRLETEHGTLPPDFFGSAGHWEHAMNVRFLNLSLGDAVNPTFSPGSRKDNLQGRKMLRFDSLLLVMLVLLVSPLPGYGASSIRPKVLIIATYEIGKDRGDAPGELQYWVEREKLDQSIQVPGLDHPILTNGKGLYAMIGGTTSRCAVQIMALAMDPRFDLRQTYFLLDGIAGGDPNQVSLASAVWVRQVVDGDSAFEIDSRETPASWPYGIVALGTTEPGKVPANVDAAPIAGISENDSGGVARMVHKLNPSLVDWAYQLTKNVTIPDSDVLAANRVPYKGYPNAQARPSVLEGESVGADRFWSGAIMTRWAEDWVRLYTRGTGSLAVTDCEDQGVVLAMQELERLGRVDPKRFLILRTVSNYSMPPPGISAERHLFDGLASSPGYLPALDAGYRVGSVVVSALLQDRNRYPVP